MKKVYLVGAEKWLYGCNNSCVVVANNKVEAFKICEHLFEEEQGKITIQEIDLSISQIVQVVSWDI